MILILKYLIQIPPILKILLENTQVMTGTLILKQKIHKIVTNHRNGSIVNYTNAYRSFENEGKTQQFVLKVVMKTKFSPFQ